ncbi:hypothetical protein IE4872_CH01778 [Rhizobium gallicum]|uniref:Uncharacterized protein n=1 Tax=Rhizobium gallicum TaxID=56730 RepID=A0A1L5NHN9_9HYPH|nr:hypothetical protein IE4872_CH01778 [Rhizobium gallicum]
MAASTICRQFMRVGCGLPIKYSLAVMAPPFDPLAGCHNFAGAQATANLNMQCNMEQFNYRRLQGTAERLIAKVGQSGTVTRVTPRDPVLAAIRSKRSYTAKLVPMEYTAPEIDGTVIQAGDVQLSISSVGIAISPSRPMASSIASSTAIPTITMA